MGEADVLLAVLSLPAGYDVGLFGVLGIRLTDQATVEVEWEAAPSLLGGPKTQWASFPKAQLKEAIQFFLEKRTERQLGSDIEAKLCREDGLIP